MADESEPDFFKAEGKYVACDDHDGMLVSLVDPWPEGRLQTQLDRMESKLDAILHDLGIQHA